VPLQCSGSAAAFDQAPLITQTIPRNASRFPSSPVAAGAAGHPLRLQLPSLRFTLSSRQTGRTCPDEGPPFDFHFPK